MSALADEAWQFSGACDDPGRLKGRCVGHRITIEAPPELVWDFIADFEGWQSWNPLYKDTVGIAEEGAEVRFAVHLAGIKPQASKAQIVTVRQHELLEYRLRNLAGLLKVFRYIEIEELSPTRCRVVNGEIMGGPLGSAISKRLGDTVAQGLKGMNEALKLVAERKWRGRPA